MKPTDKEFYPVMAAARAPFLAKIEEAILHAQCAPAAERLKILRNLPAKMLALVDDLFEATLATDEMLNLVNDLENGGAAPAGYVCQRCRGQS